MSPHLITVMILLPLIGALLQAFLPSFGGSSPGKTGRWIALAASIASGLCGLVLVASMEVHKAELQSVLTLSWVGPYAISYDVGIDGLNALLVILIGIVFPVLIAAEWDQKSGCRGIHGLFLVLQFAFVGAVCSQDLFLQFFFWALASLPFYFLIGIWGGEHRETAAFRTIVASSIGNALLFAALILIYYSIDPHTFLLRDLVGGKLSTKTFEIMGRELPVSGVAFSLICAGLALRAPVWPLHGWFTQVARESSPSVFVALTAVNLPVAVYLFIRLCYSLFPETMVSTSEAIVIIGAINLIVGGVCALPQRGLRVLLAYLCLSETGLMLIGIGSLSHSGVVGAVYHQLVLGLGLAGFGLFLGLVSERSGRTDFLDQDGAPSLGGIAAKAPAVALVSGIVIASLLGFPGMGGFVGHSLVVIGAFSVYPYTVALGGVALLLATYYLFTMYRLIFLGPQKRGAEAFADLSLREKAYLFPLIGCLLFLGLYPKPLLEIVRPTVLTLLSQVK